MIEFVSGNALTSRICQVVKSTTQIDLAVAFWGSGSIERLALPDNLEHVRILCDLTSGACNPNVVHELHSRQAKIWTKDGMHAKVYLGERAAVIGSANASANGLGEEDDELDLGLEAGVFTSNIGVIKRARAWFSSQLNDADEVEVEFIDKLCAEYNERKKHRPMRRGIRKDSLLTALDNNPKLFARRAVRLIAYEYSGFTSEELKPYRKIGPQLYGASTFKKFRRDGIYPFYIDYTGWPVSPGEWFLDFEVLPNQKNSKGIKVKFGGIWQVLSDEADYQSRGPNGSRVVFCRPRNSVYGLSFPTKDRNEIARRIQKYLERKGALDGRLPVEDEHGCLIDFRLDQLPKELCAPRKNGNPSGKRNAPSRIKTPSLDSNRN